MVQLLEMLESAADGAFIINQGLKFVYWNQAAEDITGFRKSEIIGQRCHQILRGYNEQKRLICVAACQVAREAFRGVPVPDYDIEVQTKFGEQCWLNMSILTYVEHDQIFIVHLFRNIDQKKDDQLFIQRVLEVARRYHRLPDEKLDEIADEPRLDVLTPREQDVLQLLAQGNGTSEISDLLSISPHTVRNHVQHILQKLNIHSRLEAVTYAIKNRLV